MFVLLTTLQILALGKILCQDRVNQQFTSQPSLVFIGRGLSPRVFNQPRQVPTPRPFHHTTERTKEESFYNRTNTETRLQQPTRVNQQNRRVLISRVIPERMHRHQPFVNSPVAKSTRNVTSSNDTDEYDKVKFIEDPPAEVNSVGYNGNVPVNVTRQPSTVPGPTEKPVSKPVTPGNVTAEVTLDERASFDGDQCPTGFVRINGVCVQPE